MRFERIIIALACACASCTFPEESIREVVEIPVASPPQGIETSPHDVYRGRDVYYWEGHWYKRRGRGWVYLQSEPDELRSRRQRQSGADPGRRETHSGRC